MIDTPVDATKPQAIKLRSGEVDIRVNGTTLLRLSGSDAEALGLDILHALGWGDLTQLGLKVENREAQILSRRDLNTQLERIKNSGVDIRHEVVQRPSLVKDWHPEEPELSVPQGPRQRQFVKEQAEAPRIHKKPAARPRHAEPEPAVEILFSNPEMQLRHEVWNQYLHSVPESQRKEWPYTDEYDVLPSFLADIAGQNGALSRQQIVAAIIDVITGRVWQINSRKPRPFREGGGDDGRPIVTRARDGAQAWRANVQTGTQAARRIMWWRTNRVELARLASHDDLDMPER